jgi:hypothetical protein
MRNLLWLLTSLALLLLLGCTHDALAPGQPRAASVVSMLEVVGPPPCIGLPEEQCRYADTYEPHCAAFAIAKHGQTMLVTASHCVPDSTMSSTKLRFHAPSGWGHGIAYLAHREADADVAFLTLSDPEMVTPLRVGRSPLVDERVWSYSPIYRARAEGIVTNWSRADWFETTQSITPGWSGAPVLDERGEVVGVVSQCPAISGIATKLCKPGRVVVTAALCFKAD